MNNKVICECYNVTEQDFKDAVQNKKSFEEFQSETNAGTCCGPCTVTSQELYSKLEKETTE